MSTPTTTPSPFKFTLTITLDTLCPWCYILHARLSKAIYLYNKTYNSSDIFLTHYKPYYLDASLSTTSMPLQDKIVAKNGPERAIVLQRMLARTGQGDGIRFSYGGRFGSSRDSHRLIALAGRHGGEGVQGAVVGEVFRRYYEEDADIADVGMLVEAGVVGGLERGALEGWMSSGEEGEWVDKEAQTAKDAGFVGVPHLCVESGNGSVVVDGARDVEELFELFVGMREGKVEIMGERNGEKGEGKGSSSGLGCL